jgi:REP element-mobilizing transposase RayT
MVGGAPLATSDHMARPLRLHIPGAIYHIMSRGNARQDIFLDDTDYRYFLERLSITSGRFRARCHAYCLMRNHFHLMVRAGELPVWRMMHQLNSSVSQRFNRRHQRIGHVLQGRYKALVIDGDDYFRRALRYIARNPVRACLVQRAADWPWSSYRATAGLAVAAPWLALDEVWEAFGDNPLEAQRAYADFVDGDISAHEAVPAGPVVFGSGAFVARVGRALAPHRGCREVVYAERFADRPRLIDLFAIGADACAREIAIRKAFDDHGYTLREIGEFLGVHPSTVWRHVRGLAPRGLRRRLDKPEKIEI